MKGYDKYPLNSGILLDLPFREGTGLITHDMAKPHHIATLTGPPTWDTVGTLGVLDFDGATEYLQVPGADTVDLDFTGDFTLAAWVYPVYTVQPMVIMCRNTTDVDGWCMYLYVDVVLGNTLSLRTNQAAAHTDCYGAGFPASEWQLVGYSRNQAGLTATCYRNGGPIITNFGPFGILDPVACGAGNKLLVGVQDGEISAFYGGKMWRPRAWPRELAAWEWLELFHKERDLFNV